MNSLDELVTLPATSMKLFPPSSPTLSGAVAATVNFSSHAFGVRFSLEFTNPRWLATLRSPGANFLHASGVQTSSPKGLLGH